jgi:hypothetical protein
MLFICLIYILDFILNEKYDIQCLTSYIFKIDDTEKDLNKIPDVLVDFKILVSQLLPNKLIIKTDEGEYISMVNELHYTKNISKIIGTEYEIIYQCENSNCTIYIFLRKTFYPLDIKCFI